MMKQYIQNEISKRGPEPERGRDEKKKKRKSRKDNATENAFTLKFKN